MWCLLTCYSSRICPISPFESVPLPSLYLMLCDVAVLQACVLLLTGPAGCGKTATVRTLAHDLSIAINEWLNPITEAYHSYQDDWERGKTWVVCVCICLCVYGYGYAAACLDIQYMCLFVWDMFMPMCDRYICVCVSMYAQ